MILISVQLVMLEMIRTLLITYKNLDISNFTIVDKSKTLGKVEMLEELKIAFEKLLREYESKELDENDIDNENMTICNGCGGYVPNP